MAANDLFPSLWAAQADARRTLGHNWEGRVFMREVVGAGWTWVRRKRV